MLAAASACPEGRARRRTLGEQFARALEAEPAIAALLAALDGGDDSIHAADALLRDPDWLVRLIDRSIAACHVDALFEPPLQPIGRYPREGLRLFAHPRLTISLLRLPAPLEVSGTIGFGGQRSLVRFLGAPPRLNFWKVEEGHCRAAGARQVARDAHFAVDGLREAWSIAPGSTPALLLQAGERAGSAPLATYDVRSGVLLSRTATDSAAMRLQLITSLLCRMGREDAAPALRGAAASGPPHLRWHIARELTALAPDAARPLLNEMAADGHADIRAAARRTLKLLAA